MIRNREIKGFLDRTQARTVAQSPLVQNTFGQGAIQFAAVEIAKAIASGFRTDLSNHIASFDLMGATITKHYVAHRPQCPTCGNKKLWNPKREPQPVDIHPGTKLIMVFKCAPCIGSPNEAPERSRGTTQNSGGTSRIMRLR